MGFPNVAKKLAEGLPSRLTPIAGVTFAAGTVVPASLTGIIFLRLTQVGGAADRITQYPLVHLDVFAQRYSHGYDVSVEAQELLLNSRRIGSLILDNVLCLSGPVEAPWDNTETRRLLSIYRISTRR